MVGQAQNKHSSSKTRYEKIIKMDQSEARWKRYRQNDSSVSKCGFSCTLWCKVSSVAWVSLHSTAADKSSNGQVWNLLTDYLKGLSFSIILHLPHWFHSTNPLFILFRYCLEELRPWVKLSSHNFLRTSHVEYYDPITDLLSLVIIKQVMSRSAINLHTVLWYTGLCSQIIPVLQSSTNKFTFVTL